MLVTVIRMSKYRPKDFYFRKAKQEGLRARSAFKLDEIAKRFHLFRAGHSVLDLGAAPGGFVQIIADRVGARGRVVAVDLVSLRSFNLPQVKTLTADVLAPDFDAQLRGLYQGSWDSVISDMAPKTSGVKATDEARSLALAGRALEIAKKRGKRGSSFVAKVFMGGDFEQFREAVRVAYEDVKLVRPEATRGSSAEIYVIGLGLKAVSPSGDLLSQS